MNPDCFINIVKNFLHHYLYSPGAEETDFNEFTDRRSLMNEVLRQVFTCTAIGLNLMESETYLDDLTGKQGVWINVK